RPAPLSLALTRRALLGTPPPRRTPPPGRTRSCPTVGCFEFKAALGETRVPAEARHQIGTVHWPTCGSLEKPLQLFHEALLLRLHVLAQLLPELLHQRARLVAQMRRNLQRHFHELVAVAGADAVRQPIAADAQHVA